MSFTLTPSSLPSSNEGIAVNQTVEITTSGFGGGTVESLTVTRSSIEGTIAVATDVSGPSFTITGKYNDNFDKSITYQDSNGATKTATRWKNLEPGYNLIEKFTPSTGGSVPCTYTVVINGTTTLTIVQTVTNSGYSGGKEGLVTAVAGAKY
jgi:hypothetical protein